VPVPSIFWLVAMVLLFAAEAITVGLTSIWFGVGACRRTALCLVVSFRCRLAVRPLARKYVNPARVATNADRVIGAEGIVTQDIDNLKAQGQITVQGAVWTARTEPDAAAIPSGAKVRVLRIEGVKVIVTPAAEAARTPQV